MGEQTLPSPRTTAVWRMVRPQTMQESVSAPRCAGTRDLARSVTRWATFSLLSLTLVRNQLRCTARTSCSWLLAANWSAKNWIVDGAEQRLTGVFDSIGPAQPLTSLLEEIAEMFADVEFVRAMPEQLEAAGVTHWAGPRSLPLWLPPSLYGMSAHDAQPSLDAGTRDRPDRELLRSLDLRRLNALADADAHVGLEIQHHGLRQRRPLGHRRSLAGPDAEGKQQHQHPRHHQISNRLAKREQHVLGGHRWMSIPTAFALAAALLGDPAVLILDEPVNGLDPEGIVWIRTLMQRLAAEGRTVFVSSHLMNEMAVTAEHLIVIGQGKLIADCSTQEFIDRSTQEVVVVRSPDAGRSRESWKASCATSRVDTGCGWRARAGPTPGFTRPGR